MEILNSLVQTLKLDQSFFYHLILAVFLYFISKKWLFRPYIFAMNQRRKLTKGRLEKSEDEELEIQKKKDLYDKKAQKIHKDFQELFSKMKNKAGEDFSKDSLKLEKEQKAWLKREKKNLEENAQKQNEILEKQIPQLKTALLSKIKS